MKALIQRVTEASVVIDGKTHSQIKKGLLILLGVGENDTQSDADYLIGKILNLRLFPSEKSGFDYDIQETKGELLIVSQFTLYASIKKGRRPDFFDAAKPEKATELYEYFVAKCRELGIKTQTGVFAAHMEVKSINDGPVTIMAESNNNI